MRYNTGMDSGKPLVQYDVGVYGGAFDPVHNGHVALMQYVISALGLKRLVVLPSGNSPHKRSLSPFRDRVVMLRAATRHIPQVVVDEAEQSHDGPAYSSDMLPILHAKYGDFVHIVGSDSIIGMPHWHCPELVMRFPHVVVVRGAASAELQAAVDYARRTYGATVSVLPTAIPPYSSTDVRLFYRIGRTPTSEDLRQGQIALDKGTYYPMANGVCYSVHDYIRTQGLYDEYHHIVNEVPSRISPERWAHTQEVALMAVRLNRQLRLPEEKVIVAALLHDCMKGASYVYPAVPADCRQGAVVHAFNGAEEARHRYGVVDEDVLDAIRYHTTGRAGMSDLERLIYLADYCEATRTHAGVDEVRAAALADFDRGFAMAVEATHRHVNAKGGEVCALGEQCYAYYCLPH